MEECSIMNERKEGRRKKERKKGEGRSNTMHNKRVNVSVRVREKEGGLVSKPIQLWKQCKLAKAADLNLLVVGSFEEVSITNGLGKLLADL